MGKGPGSDKTRTSRVLPLVIALLISVALVSLGLFSFHEDTASSRPVVVSYDYFWCSEDAHCVIVDKIGCCSCEQGGGQAAVNAWHRDDLRRFLKTACRPHKKQVCVQMDLCRDEFEARCIDRRCQLVVPGN